MPVSNPEDSTDNTGLSYKDAGVDIDAGDALVRAIAPLAAATKRPGCNAELGGFGGLFDLKEAGYSDPVLVAATDGVGTKLKLAFAADRHDTVGIDLVAMCVNDLVVQGAEPLFFLDYFATGKLSGDVARDVVAGIAEGCTQAGCALIGGETAEMPGMYDSGEYDLAGFSVGAMERGQGLDGSTIAPGDAILGMASNGVHSNGFSLVRAVIERAGLEFASPSPFENGESLAESFLTPTRIYVKSTLALHRAGYLKGLAHITGGGLSENIPRVLPDGTAASIDAGAWDLPNVFGWLKDSGGLAAQELIRTFNCGIGMVAIVPAGQVDAATAILETHGETVCRIGEIVSTDGKPSATISGTAGTWGYADNWNATTGDAS